MVLTTKEVAVRISAHLQRFEQDAEIINASRTTAGMRLTPYYNASAVASGRFVRVTYVSYQGTTAMPLDAARRYLAWLDGGHVGTHHDMQREQAEAG